MDEFTRRRLENAHASIMAERGKSASQLGLPVEVFELLDCLSLVVAEDSECATHIRIGADYLCNIVALLGRYDIAQEKFPELLSKRSVVIGDSASAFVGPKT